MDVSVKKIIRNVTSSIVAIVAMFSIILTMGIVFFKTTLINENTYKNIFEKVGIYDEVLKSVEENVTYALVVNNVNTDILDNLISKEEIVDAIDSVTYSVIGFLKGNDTVTSPDMGIYEKRVDDAINKYLSLTKTAGCLNILIFLLISIFTSRFCFYFISSYPILIF